MKYIPSNKILLLIFLVLGVNLILARLDFVILRIPLDIYELAESFSLSYVTGYLVYFLTTQLPKAKSDQTKLDIVKEAVEHKIDRIEVRLKWLKVKDINTKYSFKETLSNIKYGETIPGVNNTNGCDALLQIKNYVEQLREQCMPILLATENPKLIKEFTEITIRSPFLSPNLKYNKNKQEQIKNDSIEIGESLYKMITSLKGFKEKL